MHSTPVTSFARFGNMMVHLGQALVGFQAKKTDIQISDQSSEKMR